MGLLGRIQLIELYQAQESRLKMQLKHVREQLRLEAVRINAQLLADGEAQRTLAAHGVPSRIIAGCGYIPNPTGILVKFPNSKAGPPKADRPPFSPVTRSESATIREHAAKLAEGVAQETMDQPRK